MGNTGVIKTVIKEKQNKLLQTHLPTVESYITCIQADKTVKLDL